MFHVDTRQELNCDFLAGETTREDILAMDDARITSCSSDIQKQDVSNAEKQEVLSKKRKSNPPKETKIPSKKTKSNPVWSKIESAKQRAKEICKQL